MSSRRAAALVILFLCGLLLFACKSGNPIPDQAAEESSLVHPCDETAKADPFGLQPSSLGSGAAGVAPTQPAATASTTGITPRTAGTGLAGCDGPDFSQRCPLWASDEYDHGSGQDVGCGKTMAQCGCALTAAASLLVHYGVTRGPDGGQTTPKAMNDWFKAEARQTSAGLVSRGYVYGGVNWLAVATYAKLAAARFGTPELAYAGNLGPDLAALRREVEGGHPVILEEPRHFILATAASAEGVRISDPFYADRTRLDVPSYANRFLSGRLYRPGPDVSAIMVASPPSVRYRVWDSTGHRTGVGGGTEVLTEISQSSFQKETAWRDPTCTASSPGDAFGLQMSVLSQPGAGHYGVEVEGSGGSKFNVAVYAYDQAGGTTIKPIEGILPSSGRVMVNIEYSPAPGAQQSIELDSSPPTATPTRATAGAGTSPATGTPRPGDTVAPAATTATRTPTRTPTTKAPLTRTPTPSATPSPGPAAKIEVTLAPSSFLCTDPDSYALVTATVTDAGGRTALTTPLVFELSVPGQAPGTTTVNLGFITPTFAQTMNGAATARFYPPDSGSVQVNVRVNGIVAGPRDSAVFTCKIVKPPPVTILFAGPH